MLLVPTGRLDQRAPLARVAFRTGSDPVPECEIELIVCAGGSRLAIRTRRRLLDDARQHAAPLESRLVVSAPHARLHGRLDVGEEPRQTTAALRSPTASVNQRGGTLEPG